MKPGFSLTWGWPLAIGLATLIGLLAALVADGFWDWLSCAALSVPVAISAWRGVGWRRGQEPAQKGAAPETR